MCVKGGIIQSKIKHYLAVGLVGCKKTAKYYWNVSFDWQTFQISSACACQSFTNGEIR